jgi:hypothetical protein
MTRSVERLATNQARPATFNAAIVSTPSAKQWASRTKLLKIPPSSERKIFLLRQLSTGSALI